MVAAVEPEEPEEPEEHGQPWSPDVSPCSALTCLALGHKSVDVFDVRIPDVDLLTSRSVEVAAKENRAAFQCLHAV